MIHPNPNHDDAIVVCKKKPKKTFNSNKSADKKLQMETATLKVPN